MEPQREHRADDCGRGRQDDDVGSIARGRHEEGGQCRFVDLFVCWLEGVREKILIREKANFLRNSIIFTFHLLMPKRLRLTNYPSTSGAITHAILFPFPFYINY